MSKLPDQKCLMERFLEAGKSPWVGALSAMFAIVAGAIAALAPSNIRTSIFLTATPPPNGPDKFSYGNWGFSIEAGAFWFLALFSTLLFVWNKSGEAKAQKSAEKNLTTTQSGISTSVGTLASTVNTLQQTQREGQQNLQISAQRLEDSINRLATLPRQEFLENTLRLSISLARTEYLCSQISSQPDVDEAIRQVLYMILNLAAIFDRNAEASTFSYAANIMLFTKISDENSGTQSDNLRQKIQRVIDEHFWTPKNWIGALEGFSTLSTVYISGDHKPHHPDENLIEIALPVARQIADSELGKRRILPGAPQAFNDSTFYECPEIEQFLAGLNDYPDRSQVENLITYFQTGAGSNIKSFVCIPIPDIAYAEGENRLQTLGIINIHSVNKNILQYGSKLFWPTIQPFAISIGRLLRLRG